MGVITDHILKDINNILIVTIMDSIICPILLMVAAVVVVTDQIIKVTTLTIRVVVEKPRNTRAASKSILLNNLHLDLMDLVQGLLPKSAAKKSELKNKFLFF